MAVNLTGAPARRGPNITGWTSSTLAPKVVAPPVTPQSTAQVARAAQRAEADRARIAATKSFEKEAALSGDPTKLRQAWQEVYNDTLRLPLDYEGKLEAQSKAAKEFKQRNPTFEFLDPAAKILFEAPTGDVGKFYTEELFKRTGQGTGNWAESKKFFDQPTIFNRGARVGGGGGMASGDGDSDSGGDGLGPNPRIVTAAMTPLEQLLSSMFPDFVGTPENRDGGPLNPDLRGMGPAEGPFNNILSNLGLGGGAAAPTGGGWVSGPAISGPGAAIASTIPGAPAWLGPQINQLPGGSGGFYAPPAPSQGLDLAGLAAISAEQERQRAAMQKAKADRQAAFQAQLLADQQRQQAQDQINRQRAGGLVSSSGWSQSPFFRPTAWTPMLPTY